MSRPNQQNSKLSFEPYWWKSLKKTSAKKHQIPEDLDVLVIGAGYTGLAAAMTAHDLGARAAVCDTKVPGKGASTRNGGMFGAHPRLTWQALSRKYGIDVADEIFNEASEAQNFVERLINKEKINCDLERSGRIQLAWTQSHFESQKHLASFIASKTNIEVSIISRPQLYKEIKTNRYFGGLLFKNHCGIDPAKLHSGLVNSLNLRGVPIFENTPILSVRRENGGFRVRSKWQSLFVKKVIMATNGYTKDNFHWFQRRVFPLPSFLIATENIPGDLIKELCPGRRMMVETRAQYNYFRVSPDGKKIIFGGRAAMKPIDLCTAANRLKLSLNDIWPELQRYCVTHVWSGNTGYSFNQLPHVGQTEGIFYAMGFSGSGTVLAPYLGAKAAYLALDDPRACTPYQKTRLRTSLLHFTSKPYFLSVADFWYKNVVDRWESPNKRK